MVIIILQTVSTIMKPGTKTIGRQVGSEMIDVTRPGDIVKYQTCMDCVDRGYQHRFMGAWFANVAHFKKWYNKVFMGIVDFSFLQAYTAWNFSVEEMMVNSRREEIKRKAVGEVAVLCGRCIKNYDLCGRGWIIGGVLTDANYLMISPIAFNFQRL